MRLYITEHSPQDKRGLYGSWAMTGTFAGFLFGSLVSALFSGLFSAESLSLWGWRIPFILGLFLGLIGLYLRLGMPETPQFILLQFENKILKNPLMSSFKDGLKPMLIIAGLNSLPATSYYLSFVYLSSYFVIYLKFSLSTALTIGGIFPIIATFLIGKTGNLLSPSFCLIFMALIMLCSILFLKGSNKE